MTPSPFKLEVCIDTPQGLQACQVGVDTIELCSALAVGGLTPSAGLVVLAQSSSVPVHAMIRPRAGGFAYSPEEIDVALRDISSIGEAGLAGVVIGAATPDGKLDLPTLKKMVDASCGMSCTLHRVIDTLHDPISALEQAIDLGISRILTSGGQLKAQDGIDQLTKLQKQARDRIEIIAGSGVNAGNIAELASKTGVRSFHASCRRQKPQDEKTIEFGFGPATIDETDTAKIMQFRHILTA